MDSNLDRAFENSPVSHDAQQGPDTELWEPPFERWIRLADALLGETAALSAKTPRPQSLSITHKN
jgi:hypothetical protein